MFGDALFGKMLGILQRRTSSDRRDVRSSRPDRPASDEAMPRQPASVSRRSAKTVPAPALGRERMRSARRELVGLLDAWPGGRRMQPSLALLERAMDRDRASGLELVSPCVLAHAAVSLDLLDPTRMGPGLVELRRHLGRLLRERHDDDSAFPEATLERASAEQRSREEIATEDVELGSR